MPHAQLGGPRRLAVGVIEQARLLEGGGGRLQVALEREGEHGRVGVELLGQPLGLGLG